MVEVKVGQVYECPDLKTGQGQKGEWGMFRVKAKKGYDNIIVWASNAGSIAGATAVKVVEIQKVVKDNLLLTIPQQMILLVKKEKILKLILN